MILLTVLFLIVALLTIIAVTALVLGGTAGIVIFGDLIACVVVIVCIIRAIIKGKKR